MAICVVLKDNTKNKKWKSRGVNGYTFFKYPLHVGHCQKFSVVPDRIKAHPLLEYIEYKTEKELREKLQARQNLSVKPIKETKDTKDTKETKSAK